MSLTFPSSEPRTSTSFLSRRVILAGAAIVLISFAVGFSVGAWAPEGPVFTDVDRQSREFMAMYERIRLTPEQEAVKKAALTQLPAPCCSDNTAYTCCCPCNLSRTVWGLSAHLIVDLGYDAEQVKQKVEEWFDFTTKDSHTGDACYTGSCGKAFANGGCGGMSPDRLTV